MLYEGGFATRYGLIELEGYHTSISASLRLSLFILCYLQPPPRR
jgi:hypothetical protein